MNSAPERFVSSAASQLPRAWLATVSLLGRRLGSLVGAFAVGFGARRAINHLRSLDDDRLRDLGLEREDIGRFVRFGRD
jgi:uncharacterized protein YjiS (DUF1127 family)